MEIIIPLFIITIAHLIFNIISFCIILYHVKSNKVFIIAALEKIRDKLREILHLY
jgi:hypothetical protein